ncbi:polysaccharide pyruvyl transferase family protein [Dyadobacter sandarakinus]|uniref:Polysaccharide pyruvyl transferase family protein n=1 Tax=Dyadobacter sandarakinus TaxID=2747268 RepID=A0ABX7I4Y9_9BACT|nr:polysaccharide pyruvyl transferase family protein [Dyadobacter sandarakinus]QRR00288.1 polysaccharide pyruvyl transferase family protein [Dyadobacter sandarakinus]
MSALKAGILTFHRCINYGSYWQARCLTEGIQLRGHEATLIDHDSRRVNLSEWKCAFRPVLPTHVPESDYPIYREKIEKFFKEFDKLPLSPRFDLDQPQTMDYYDVVIVGSDEVWNLHHPWYGGHPFFYGDGIRADHLISYAASYGNYPAASGIDAHWAEKLKNFDHISVRDENSQEIVRNALGIEPVIVLDPCLQFEVHPDDRQDPYQKPYLAVYGHNFTTDYIEKVTNYARRKNLPLISIGYRNDWADEQWMTADPHDFAHFIARAEAVATNFFHGCVFALRNERPFAAEVTSYRSLKVQGLLKTVGASQHLVWEDTGQDVVDTIFSQPLDPAVTRNITAIRKTSDAYLDQALQIKKYSHEHIA